MENSNSLTISPAIAAFVVLLAAFLVVGVYVTDLDINTEGVTAEESLLPNTFSSDTAGFSGRYADNWRLSDTDAAELGPVSGPALAFQTDAEDNDAARITIARVNRPLDIVAEQMAQSIQVITEGPEAYASGESDAGQRFRVRLDNEQMPGQPDMLAEYILVEAGDGEATLVGRLRANANTLPDHLRTFELMMASLEVIEIEAATVPEGEPLALTQTGQEEQLGVQVSYPEGWTQLPDQAPNEIGFQSQANPDTLVQFFIDTPANVGATILGPQFVVENSITPEDFLTQFLTNIRADIAVIGPQAYTAGEYTGQFAVLELPDLAATFAVGPYDEDRFVVFIAQSPLDQEGDVIATAFAMLESLQPLEGGAQDEPPGETEGMDGNEASSDPEGETSSEDETDTTEPGDTESPPADDPEAAGDDEAATDQEDETDTNEPGETEAPPDDELAPAEEDSPEADGNSGDDTSDDPAEDTDSEETRESSDSDSE
ncbi:MAG: hypothetical protein GYB66_03160 [Chloroflexi bacterium]|nr:hypothetical protein [Chloroflexota bacterium]